MNRLVLALVFCASVTAAVQLLLTQTDPDPEVTDG